MVNHNTPNTIDLEETKLKKLDVLVKPAHPCNIIMIRSDFPKINKKYTVLRMLLFSTNLIFKMVPFLLITV